MSNGYALVFVLVVDAGWNSRSSMHQPRFPFHFSEGMIADLSFHQPAGDPGGSRDEM